MFFLVYRLAMDAKTRKGDGVGGLKYLSFLKDFQTCTASMARKRHLASSARGFCCFCLMASQEYTDEGPSCGVLPSRQRIGGVLSNPRALPPVTQGSALQAPECL